MNLEFIRSKMLRIQKQNLPIEEKRKGKRKYIKEILCRGVMKMKTTKEEHLLIQILCSRKYLIKNIL